MIAIGTNLAKLVTLKSFFIKPLSHCVEHFVRVDDMMRRKQNVFFCRLPNSPNMVFDQRLEARAVVIARR